MAVLRRELSNPGGIYLLYDASQNEAEAESAARKASDDIEDAFEKAFSNNEGAWENIRLEYCDVISDQAMSYADSRMLKQWRLEHISLEDDPPQPMLEE